MQRFPAVEEAKALFTQAQDWSVWKWLIQKNRMRRAADAANAALDNFDAELKSRWDPALMKAYRSKNGVDAAAARARDADQRAQHARLDAEATFAEATRLLSAGLAREGARKAIQSWQLKEAAIRASASLARKAASK